MNRLQEWTGSRWLVAVSNSPGAPSLKEQKDAKAREILTGVQSDPLVQSALAAFPGAEIVGVRPYAAPVQSALQAETGGSETNDETGFYDGMDGEP
jgi:DNA polymerase-3 subunit gamma/tau